MVSWDELQRVGKTVIRDVFVVKNVDRLKSPSRKCNVRIKRNIAVFIYDDGSKHCL